jgi:hypothetical protein
MEFFFSSSRDRDGVIPSSLRVFQWGSEGVGSVLEEYEIEESKQQE